MEDLINRIQKGDKLAFEELVLTLQRNLYIVAYVKTNDKYIMDEAFQETMIELYSNIVRKKRIDNIKAWTTKVLINRCNKLLKRKTNNIISFENIEGEEFIGESNDILSIEDRMNFFDIIKSLNEDERLIITLFYLDEYTTKDISQILKINENTIRSKIKRAREKIKHEKGNNDYGK